MFDYRAIAFIIFLVPWLLVVGMPERGKGETPFPAQQNISDNPKDCGKGQDVKQPRFVQGEVLVKFKAGVTKEGVDLLRETYGLSLMKRIRNIGVYRFQIPPGSSVAEVVEALNQDPRVEYAEPNYIMSIDVR